MQWYSADMVCCAQVVYGTIGGDGACRGEAVQGVR